MFRKGPISRKRKVWRRGSYIYYSGCLECKPQLYPVSFICFSFFFTSDYLRPHRVSRLFCKAAFHLQFCIESLHVIKKGVVMHIIFSKCCRALKGLQAWIGFD